MSHAAHTPASVVPLDSTPQRKGSGEIVAGGDAVRAPAQSSQQGAPLAGIFKLVSTSSSKDSRKQRLAGQIDGGAAAGSGAAADGSSEIDNFGSLSIGQPLSHSSLPSTTIPAEGAAPMSGAAAANSPVVGRQGTGDYYHALTKLGSSRRLGSGRRHSGDASGDLGLPPAAAAAAAVPDASRDPARSLHAAAADSGALGPDPTYKESWLARVFNPPHMQSVRRIRLYGAPEGVSGALSARSARLPPPSPSLTERLTNPPHFHNARSRRLDPSGAAAAASAPANALDANAGRSPSFLRRLLEPRNLQSARSMRLARESASGRIAAPAAASASLTEPSEDLALPPVVAEDAAAGHFDEPEPAAAAAAASPRGDVAPHSHASSSAASSADAAPPPPPVAGDLYAEDPAAASGEAEDDDDDDFMLPMPVKAV